MKQRSTKEQVERYMELARTHCTSTEVPWVDNHGKPYVAMVNVAGELAAEVKALRAELLMAEPLFSRRQLQEKLSRVEALPADLRAEIEELVEQSAINAYIYCAIRIEDALKGKP